MTRAETRPVGYRLKGTPFPTKPHRGTVIPMSKGPIGAHRFHVWDVTSLPRHPPFLNDDAAERK